MLYLLDFQDSTFAWFSSYLTDCSLRIFFSGFSLSHFLLFIQKSSSHRSLSAPIHDHHTPFPPDLFFQVPVTFFFLFHACHFLTISSLLIFSLHFNVSSMKAGGLSVLFTDVIPESRTWMAYGVCSENGEWLNGCMNDGSLNLGYKGLERRQMNGQNYWVAVGREDGVRPDPQCWVSRWFTSSAKPDGRNLSSVCGQRYLGSLGDVQGMD